MAITPVGALVTLGITASLASSVSVFSPFSAFSCQGWLYTGSNVAEKPLFYIGEQQTPFVGGGSYVSLVVDVAGVLTLRIFDGSTLTEFTGATLAADTWYAWS